MVYMERKGGRSDEGMVIRKGPWMPEEDEILINYVNKYGPRDWSSIRSKGLLPRTGKSCRLRWVNKLKPNLKTGCKFSAEEERIVIDLQARFGNKWARIATYLSGRTDNDVKNFWSTRQKRLARMLHRPLQPNLQQNHGKLLVVGGEAKLAYEASTPGHDQFTLSGEETSTSQCGNPCNLGNSENTNMLQLPDLMSPNMLTNLETALFSPEQAIDRKPCLLNNPPKFPFHQLPQAQLHIPSLTEGQDLLNGFPDMNFQDPFACREASGMDLFLEGIPSSFDLEGGCNDTKRDYESPSVPDFFDDFPADMFDYLEPNRSTKEW